MLRLSNQKDITVPEFVRVLEFRKRLCEVAAYLHLKNITRNRPLNSSPRDIDSSILYRKFNVHDELLKATDFGYQALDVLVSIRSLTCERL